MFYDVRLASTCVGTTVIMGQEKCQMCDQLQHLQINWTKIYRPTLQ